MFVAATSTVTVHVLLFASYAELLGSESVELSFDQPATVADALERLRALPGGQLLPTKPLCAVNLAHVPSNTALNHGDELAILPPLAGG